MRDSSDLQPEAPDWLSPDYAALDEPKPPVPFPPDPPPPHSVEAWRPAGWQGENSLARLATELFDRIDAIADRIAEGLGLR